MFLTALKSSKSLSSLSVPKAAIRCWWCIFLAKSHKPRNMEITAIRNPEPCRKRGRILLFIFFFQKGGGWGGRRRKEGGKKLQKNQQQEKRFKIKKKAMLDLKFLNPKPEEKNKKAKFRSRSIILCNRRFSQE